MSSSKPRFEQVPLQFVKKLLEKQTEVKQKESSKDQIFEPPTKKTEPYTLPQLLRERCRSELGGQNRQIAGAMAKH